MPSVRYQLPLMPSLCRTSPHNRRSCDTAPCHLAELDVSHNAGIGSAGLAALLAPQAPPPTSTSPPLPSLTTLTCAHCAIDDGATSTLVHSLPIAFPALTALDLSSNALTCDAAVALLPLGSHLRTLRLAGNAIADSGTPPQH
jgi:hypothetical protein